MLFLSRLNLDILLNKVEFYCEKSDTELQKCMVCSNRKIKIYDNFRKSSSRNYALGI